MHTILSLGASHGITGISTRSGQVRSASPGAAAIDSDEFRWGRLEAEAVGCEGYIQPYSGEQAVNLFGVVQKNVAKNRFDAGVTTITSSPHTEHLLAIGR